MAFTVFLITSHKDMKDRFPELFQKWQKRWDDGITVFKVRRRILRVMNSNVSFTIIIIF